MTYKVFLSYAYADNGGRWIDVLRDKLRISLGDDCEVWVDTDLPRNAVFEDRIPEALRTSDALIAIISPAYLKSKWCGSEGTRFLQQLMGNFASKTPNQEGIFVVDSNNVWKDIDTENSPIEPPDAAELVRTLKKRVAGTYKFWDGDVARRICEPYYTPGHADAPQFDNQLTKLASQLSTYLDSLPSKDRSVARVIAVPPLRNSGKCWKEYKALWRNLGKQESLRLVPLFGPAITDDLTAVEGFSADSYANSRKELLSNLPRGELLVQLLGPSYLDWDDSVAAFSQKAKSEIESGCLMMQVHASEMAKDEFLALIETSKEVIDKEGARQLYNEYGVTPYSSPEDLASQVLAKAKRCLQILAQRHASASLDPRVAAKPAAVRPFPILVEACENDSALAAQVQLELYKQGLEFTNRDFYVDRTNPVRSGLEKLYFKSIMYVCENGPRRELFERANENVKVLVESSDALPPRAAIFYSPPQEQGFAPGSTVAFEKDFPMTIPTEEGSSGKALIDWPPDAKSKVLSRTIVEFRDWVRSRG